MDKLFTLLSLARQALEAPTRQALSHIVVNDTLRLVPYVQAIFWRGNEKSCVLEKVSGNAVLDNKSPFAESVRKSLVLVLAASREPVNTLDYEGKSVAVVIFQTQEEGIIGGLWLEREQAFQKPEIQILEELAVSYTHAFASLSLKDRFGFWNRVGKREGYRKFVLPLFALLCLFPVHSTITAPAEIVAENPDIVTVPFDGMIEKVFVDPGAKVSKGQVVAVMEDSVFSAELHIAEQALRVAEASLDRTQREALQNAERKSDITLLEAEIAEKRIEMDYAKDRRKKSEILSPRRGTAIFSDAGKLEGKPARMGEALMMVANPEEAELLIRVPVEALVPVSISAPVHFYLNVSPLSGREAVLESIGYQASLDPDGLLTYKLRASIPVKDGLRIGWQGSAKIKGEWTILCYALMRRPFAAFRYLTGI